MALRFDGKVVVVTGAGGGLGRQYALEFAKRGAKIVVNDLGASTSGTGGSTKAADVVVDEIKAMKGEAVANYDSVADGDKIIETAVQAFGTVHILINNAGILRDVSFSKMADKDWELIMEVHVKGAYKCAKAAWPHMLKQQYGRIVNVTSAAGIYGNFGQVNYSTAKSGLMGFTKSCALEGAKKNIYSNCVAPLAASRMTETVMPKDMLDRLGPEFVVPLVQYMCHDSSGVNGEIVEAGGGWYAKVAVQRTKGTFINKVPSPEDIGAAWEKISDFTDPDSPKGIQESIMAVMAAQSKL